jgi:hypothetical protein
LGAIGVNWIQLVVPAGTFNESLDLLGDFAAEVVSEVQ